MQVMSLRLDRIGEALALAEQHWNQRHRSADKAAPHGLTIALSREAGTPGTTIARELGARLHWPVYDHELVEQIARQMGVPEYLLDDVDEHRKSWLLQCLEAFGSVRVSECAYSKRLRETIVSLAARGQCVIVGRGAPCLLPPQTTLRVRLTGSLEDRIARTCQQRNLSRDAAAQWIAATDRERLDFVRTHFFADAADERNYDLVVNTSQWPVPRCVDLIVEALNEAERRLSEANAQVSVA
jgi:cytidylate kinase